MATGVVLSCIAVLLGCAGLAVVAGHRSFASRTVYGTALAASTVALSAALAHL